MLRYRSETASAAIHSLASESTTGGQTEISVCIPSSPAQCNGRENAPNPEILPAIPAGRAQLAAPPAVGSTGTCNLGGRCPPESAKTHPRQSARRLPQPTADRSLPRDILETRYPPP